MLAVGGACAAVGAAFVLMDSSQIAQHNLVQLAMIVLATGAAAVVGGVRQRQAEKFAEISRLASVAQQAILRPLGPRVGPITLEILGEKGRVIRKYASTDPAPPVQDKGNWPWYWFHSSGPGWNISEANFIFCGSPGLTLATCFHPRRKFSQWPTWACMVSR